MSAAAHHPHRVVLGYWRIKGLAAHIRMLLEFLRVPFDDVTFKQGDRSTGFDRSEWLNVKFTLPLAFPNLPYLLDGDTKITQSIAIFNFIAKKYGPAHADVLHVPHGLAEETEHDMLLHTLADFADSIASVMYSPNYAQLVPDFLSKTLPTWLDQFAKFLGDKHFLLGGDKPSPVDFFLFELLDRSVIHTSNILVPHPVLAQFHARVKNLPRLAPYFASAASSFPVNNAVAAWNP